jgi:CRISPR-associated protein Cas2
MMIIVTENAPARLRGRLTFWLTEVRASTYVGAYGRRVRERIWADVTRLIGGGSAVLVWSTSASESGFLFEAMGDNRRHCELVDGLTLVRFTPHARTPQ